MVEATDAVEDSLQEYQTLAAELVPRLVLVMQMLDPKGQYPLDVRLSVAKDWCNVVYHIKWHTGPLSQI